MKKVIRKDCHLLQGFCDWRRVDLFDIKRIFVFVISCLGHIEIRVSLRSITSGRQAYRRFCIVEDCLGKPECRTIFKAKS